LADGFFLELRGALLDQLFHAAAPSHIDLGVGHIHDALPARIHFPPLLAGLADRIEQHVGRVRGIVDWRNRILDTILPHPLPKVIGWRKRRKDPFQSDRAWLTPKPGAP
jgi:hypothetical protein